MLTTFMFAITNPVLPFAPTVSGGEMVGKIISAAIGMFLIFGFIIAFFHLLFGAFTWITASGDKSSLESAQNRITQAIIGLIIMFAVWAVMVLLGNFLGIKFPNFNLPSISNPGSSSNTGGNTSNPSPRTCCPEGNYCPELPPCSQVKTQTNQTDYYNCSWIDDLGCAVNITACQSGKKADWQACQAYTSKETCKNSGQKTCIN